MSKRKHPAILVGMLLTATNQNPHKNLSGPWLLFLSGNFAKAMP